MLNVINLTCEARELAKASALLEKWTPSLPASLQEEALMVLKGRIEFYAKRYTDAARQFFLVKRFSHHLMELIARTTSVQSYYELKEYDVLASFCMNFAKALTRSEDRFSQHYRDAYGNFVKMVQALISVKSDPSTDLIEKQVKLQQKIAKQKALVCKNWLMQQIEVL